MKIIIGLGNPGNLYDHTRHNLGFFFLDILLQRWKAEKIKKKNNSLLYQIPGETTLLFVKPQTFMNLSGTAVGPLVSFYHCSLENVFVLHDDLDLPRGEIRFKNQGGTAGHKGLISLHQHLRGDTYKRLRIGIGRPLSGSVENFVLEKMDSSELDFFHHLASSLVPALQQWISTGKSPLIK